ncbi:hypothetical protein [Alkanindiges illinoisensis]|uniref:Intradiol ring-cleavage dioxygenase n=1 Tax=Alkanindiges illinoisensis TaxID=197183 RepID=A0A4Y7XAK0_9GAMM|nr:hypothetical protein [Alkanindiges illinoisensis]TEU24978.1 hypothetical protein E2B99_10475 [Alkanindiges illinoisensis]
MPQDSKGLNNDVQQIMARQWDRRQLLGYGAGGTAALLLAGCGGSSGDSSTSSTVASSGSASNSIDTTSGSTDSTGAVSSCGNIPEETEGPYPADGSNGVNVLTRSGIVRSDIRTSLNTGNVAQGVPLSIVLKLVNTNNACAALEGYAIYLWHCNRDGNYSLYSSSIASEDYLRGVQQTSADGVVTFSSIFPACYDGRWAHIHFEVYRSLDAAMTYRNKIRTSQLAMPQDICQTVYANASGYTASQSNLSRASLSTDNVFRDGYSLQLSSVTGSVTAGYVATLIVGVAV